MSTLQSRLLTALVALPMLLFSCLKEDPDIDGPGGEGQLVTFTLRVPGESTPSTRAMTTAAESEVAEIDILLFDIAANGGGYAYHTSAGAVSVTNNEGTFRVRLPIGTYDMVLVANAASEVSSILPRLMAHTTKSTFQQMITFKNLGKWPALSPSHRTIPMWAELDNVTTASGAAITGVNLTRSLAKINVEVTASNFTLTQVQLYHSMMQGFLIPTAGNYAGSPPRVSAPSVVSGWVRSSSAALSYTAAAGEISSNACKNEIYTFEAPAGDGSATAGGNMSSGNTFLVIGGRWNGDAAVTYYRVDIATQAANGTVTYLPILRNHRYEVVIQGVPTRGALSAANAVAEGPANITAELVVRNEADMHYYVYDDRYFIGADDREVRVSYKAGSYSFNVRTDYPAGWRAVASDDPDDPTAGSAWLSTSSTGGTGTNQLWFYYTANNDTVEREGYIHIIAGERLKATVKITQKAPFNIHGFTQSSLMLYGYVGAFWKKDQTGERLIRFHRSMYSGTNIDGPWTATVVEGEDWIVMDTEDTKDVNIYTSNAADMNQNDALYQVNSTLTTVSGDAGTTGDVYFRIGLKSTYTPTAAEPVRYGAILLKFANNSHEHLIFVRQGEDPDYLYRPEDNNTAGDLHSMTAGTAAKPRPYARKWSPYNLTTEAVKSGGDMVSVSTRGGIFTDYPSQTGAYFKGALTPPLAYSPVITYNIGYGYFDVKFWDVIQSSNETCPVNYHRPNSGSTSKAVKSSNEVTPLNNELLQSLFFDPISVGYQKSNKNILRGYIADGYFDRRQIGRDVSNTVSYSTVERLSPNAANTGYLLYNPYTFASIFFPLAGAREEGLSPFAGRGGYYWTSTAGVAAGTTGSNNMHVFMLDENNKQYVITEFIRSTGFSIRCVLDE